MDDNLILAPSTGQLKKNFAGLDDEYANFKKAKVVILQVPYEKTTTYKKGTSEGPAAIIDASLKMELFDDELNQETYRIGIHPASALMFGEAQGEDMVGRVAAAVADLLKAGKFPVVLGGEHSITPGAVKAAKEAYPNLSVLHLDAHYDLKDKYVGSKYNHGCAARRMSEICPIVQVGLRSLAKEEKEFLSSNSNGAKIKSISVYDILDRPFWKDEAARALSENVYVTIDMDVFDPSLVPAVGTPEPGGIGWYEILELLHSVAEDKKIVGFDVVELCPIKDQPASDFLAAKLIYRLLGYIFGNKK